MINLSNNTKDQIAITHGQHTGKKWLAQDMEQINIHWKWITEKSSAYELCSI